MTTCIDGGDDTSPQDPSSSAETAITVPSLRRGRKAKIPPRCRDRKRRAKIVDCDGEDMGAKTLCDLTTKFMQMIKESPDGTLDLSKVAKSLPRRQKRRIYDITNVLEGIQLIAKTQRCEVKWMGSSKYTGSLECPVVAQPRELASQIARLEKEEAMIDEQIGWMKTTISKIYEDDQHRDYLYLTQDEVAKYLTDDIHILTRTGANVAIQAIVPEKRELDENCHVTQDDASTYRLRLQSKDRPIGVMLFGTDSVPVSRPGSPDAESLAVEIVNDESVTRATGQENAMSGHKATRKNNGHNLLPLREHVSQNTDRL